MGLFFYMVDVLEDFSAIKLFKWPWSQLAVDCRFHWLLKSVSRKSAPSVTRCLPLSLQGNILFYDYEYTLMGLFFYMVDVLEDFSAIKLFKWPWSQLAVDCCFHWLLNQSAERALRV